MEKRQDLISRQAAIDALRVAYWDDNIQSAKDDPCIVDAMTDWAIRQVKALPSVQPERKTGRWIDDNCSECGQYVFHGDVRNFCPNCGAKMENNL